MKITTTWARSGLNSLLYCLVTSCHNVARYAARRPFQPHSDRLLTPLQDRDMFAMAIPCPLTDTVSSLQQSNTTNFAISRPDGPVKPDHIWNTALNTCALTTPNFGYISTQSRHGDIRDLAPSSRTNHFGPLSGLAKRPVERISEPDRNARNEYLREARRHGLSYKEIKCRGDFTEAESTLRGRHRILFKPKEMRVRNPQWNYSDVRFHHQSIFLILTGTTATDHAPRQSSWALLQNLSGVGVIQDQPKSEEQSAMGKGR
ncbi:hypothetical protein KCU64_g21481, partial [Aureobasidium melanogenum]